MRRSRPQCSLWLVLIPTAFIALGLGFPLYMLAAYSGDDGASTAKSSFQNLFQHFSSPALKESLHVLQTFPSDSPLKRRSVQALQELLSTKFTDPPLFVAGLPTFPRVFARDSILSSFLMDDPESLANIISFGASHIGKRANPKTGEEYGKIFHEMPGFPLNGLNTEYAACDTTPLFVIGIHRLMHLTLFGNGTLANETIAAGTEFLDTSGRGGDSPLVALVSRLLRQQTKSFQSRHLRSELQTLLLLSTVWSPFLHAIHYIQRHISDKGLFVDDPIFAEADAFALKVTYWKDSVAFGRENGVPASPVSYALAHAQALCAVRSAAKVIRFIRQLRQASLQGHPSQEKHSGDEVSQAKRQIRVFLASVDANMLETLESMLGTLSRRMAEAIQVHLWDADRGRLVTGVDERGWLAGDGTDGLHALYYLETGDLSINQLALLLSNALATLSTPLGFRSMSEADDAAAPMRERYHSGSIWLFEQGFIHAATACSVYGAENELAQLLDDETENESLSIDHSIEQAERVAFKGLAALHSVAGFPERLDIPRRLEDAAKPVPLGTHTQQWTAATALYLDRVEKAESVSAKTASTSSFATCVTVTAGQLSMMTVDVRQVWHLLN